MIKKQSSYKDNSSIVAKLKKELEKVKKENEKLQEENKKLKSKFTDMEEILKNTQIQYVSLKNEFDAYHRRIQSQQTKLNQEVFEKTILKILPVLELFIKSYEHLPEKFKEHKWSEGLDIIHKKILQFLEDHGIKIIPTVGQEPNDLYHEIIHVQPTDKDKGKIIQEVKKGYLIKTNEGEKILLPAKVIVGK